MNFVDRIIWLQMFSPHSQSNALFHLQFITFKLLVTCANINSIKSLNNFLFYFLCPSSVLFSNSYFALFCEKQCEPQILLNVLYLPHFFCIHRSTRNTCGKCDVRKQKRTHGKRAKKSLEILGKLESLANS